VGLVARLRDRTHSDDNFSDSATAGSWGWSPTPDNHFQGYEDHLVSAGFFDDRLGIGLFVAPVQAGELFWPWKLTALTGRAIGAWLIGIGTAAAHIAYEKDWWRGEVGALAFWVFGALELVTLARFATDRYQVDGEPVLDWSDPILWAYLLFLISIVAVGLKGWITARRGSKE
jgi:hypothetical protein